MEVVYRGMYEMLYAVFNYAAFRPLSEIHTSYKLADLAFREKKHQVTTMPYSIISP